MEVQKKGQRNIIGRHVEQALLAHIRAEREALRQQIEWPVSRTGEDRTASPKQPAAPPPRRSSPPEPQASRVPSQDQDAWTYKDEEIPDITDLTGPRTAPPATQDRFSSLAQKIHKQLEGQGTTREKK